MQNNVSLHGMSEHYLPKLNQIKAFVFDVDGVLTDNTLLANEKGELWRTFHARDGFGLKIAIDKGYTVAIITGGYSQNVKRRLQMFGIEHFYDKVEDKKACLLHFFQKTKIKPEETLYTGDDIPDVDAMKICALRCAPRDAVPEVIAVSNYVCKQNGGRGCVREIIEMVLKNQNNWFAF